MGDQFAAAKAARPQRLAVQVERDRWLVCSLPARGHPSIDALQALIDEWAEEEGTRPLAVRVGDEPVPLRGRH